MILLTGTCEGVGVLCGTECYSSVFVFKASADLFSFQSESLPEVFCLCRVFKSINVVAVFCGFAKLEGV